MIKELCATCHHAKLMHYPGPRCAASRCHCEGFSAPEYKDQERLVRAAKGYAIGQRALAEAMFRNSLAYNMDDALAALRAAVR